MPTIPPIVIDSHNDSIVEHLIRGGLPFNPALPPRDMSRPGIVRLLRDSVPESEPIQLNVPKMKKGGIDAAFFAIDITRAHNSHLAYALDGYGFFEEERLRDPQGIILATCTQDLLDAKDSGRPAAILVLENSDGLEGSLHVLTMMYRMGLRVIGLTHNPRSIAADGVGEEGTGGGLTAFGKQLVKAMNRLGMLVDVSHLSEAGFWDVLKTSSHPVIASHSCCRTLCDHPRNLRDEQLKALADMGGVVGITFVPFFVDADNPTFQRLIDHIDHAVNVAGIDHVGIGSDFDGGGTLLHDATEFPRIATALQQRGYKAQDVQKIMGGNHFRLLADVCG